MPATYQPSSHTQPHITLTVGELIQILAKQPLASPVVLTYEGVENGVSLQEITVEHGCVVIDAERGSWFVPEEWEEYGNGGRDG